MGIMDRLQNATIEQETIQPQAVSRVQGAATASADLVATLSKSRRRKKEPLMIHLEPELVDQIRKIAKAAHCSESAVGRELIKRALEKA